jgi:hypothetical protein
MYDHIVALFDDVALFLSNALGYLYYQDFRNHRKEGENGDISEAWPRFLHLKISI